VLAQCDFGVVGKTLHGEPTGGIAIGGEVAHLKQLSTKPLVIVPSEVQPVRSALFAYTEHPEAGHALSLAQPLSAKGVAIKLLSMISPLGRTELYGGGAGYLEAHNVPFDLLKTECTNCGEESGSAVGEVLSHTGQEDVDLVVMGGTHRGLLGRLVWPEMADGVAWNARVPVLIWY
jgi:nucleotide-binding universal stress UspA family protein